MTVYVLWIVILSAGPPQGIVGTTVSTERFVDVFKTSQACDVAGAAAVDLIKKTQPDPKYVVRWQCSNTTLKG